MTTPHVSVIIPVYNVGRLLRTTLASVTAQTYGDLEIVVVDDGSTDGATRTALEAAARLPAVTVHRSANRGLLHARNLAITHARGTYVVPLDADDTIAPGFLAETVPLLDAHPEAGVVYTWVQLFGRERRVWRTGGFSVRELLPRNTLHVTALVRRRLWEDVGGYDPRFLEGGEDWDFWLSAAARGWHGIGIPRVLASYRRRASGLQLGLRTTPGGDARLMRRMVAKHRALYEAHLEDTLAALYELAQGTGLMLDRVYAHPVMRLATRLRSLVARPRPT